VDRVRRRVTPTAVNSAVSTGWLHEVGTKLLCGEVVDLRARVDECARGKLVEQVGLQDRDAVEQVLDALDVLGRRAPVDPEDLVLVE
jgi:hypothetical protein